MIWRDKLVSLIHYKLVLYHHGTKIIAQWIIYPGGMFDSQRWSRKIYISLTLASPGGYHHPEAVSSGREKISAVSVCGIFFPNT